jgi:hypothetical protein
VQALHEDYRISPNGSADGWNKGAMLQKRMGYYQTFQGNPYIRMDEMTKWVIEAEDPRLVKRLYQDPGITEKDQSEQQVLECIMMATGYPAQVHPADDDKTHLMILDQFCQDKLARQQMTPEMAQMFIDHGSQHMGQLSQRKDKMLKAVEAKLQPTAQALAMVAAQVQQPNNVLQMNSQTGGASADQSQPNATGSTPSSATNQDKPSAVMNALASLLKSGAPVTRDEVSAAMVSAGLPPLGTSPAAAPPPELQKAISSHFVKSEPSSVNNQT